MTDASGNPDIQTGQKGRVVASEGIETKELPATLSKAWGDIHPYGNPHVWLDPVNAKQIAPNIAAGLTRVDPDGKDDLRREPQGVRATRSTTRCTATRWSRSTARASSSGCRGATS